MTEEGDGKSKTALTPKGSTVSRTQGPRGRLVEGSLVLEARKCFFTPPYHLHLQLQFARLTLLLHASLPSSLNSPHLTVLVSLPSPAIDGQHVIYEAENNPDAPVVPSHARAQPCCLSPPTGRSDILTY
jgi:hypothetical protein